MDSSNYADPVAKLLSYGDYHEVNFGRKWPDYPSELGLSLADVPELIRMATDLSVWSGKEMRFGPVSTPSDRWGNCTRLKPLSL